MLNQTDEVCALMVCIYKRIWQKSLVYIIYTTYFSNLLHFLSFFFVCKKNNVHLCRTKKKAVTYKVTAFLIADY